MAGQDTSKQGGPNIAPPPPPGYMCPKKNFNYYTSRTANNIPQNLSNASVV